MDLTLVRLRYSKIDYNFKENVKYVANKGSLTGSHASNKHHDTVIVNYAGANENT